MRKINAIVIFAFVAAWAAAAVCLGNAAWKAERFALQDCVVAYPKSTQAMNTTYKAIESVNEKAQKALITYSASGSVTANVKNAGYPAEAVYTNELYAQICGLGQLSGSFLTKDAVKDNLKYVALNDDAAFEFFGGYDIVGLTLDIGGTKHKVLGVVQDQGDQQSRVYLPVTAYEGSLEYVAIHMDGITHAEAMEQFAYLFITKDAYDFVDTRVLGGGIQARFTFAVDLFCLAALGLLFSWALRAFLRRAMEIRAAVHNNVYARELLFKRPLLVLKTVFAFLFAAVAPSAGVLLASRHAGQYMALFGTGDDEKAANALPLAAEFFKASVLTTRIFEVFLVTAFLLLAFGAVAAVNRHRRAGSAAGLDTGAAATVAAAAADDATSISEAVLKDKAQKYAVQQARPPAAPKIPSLAVAANQAASTAQAANEAETKQTDRRGILPPTNKPLIKGNPA